MKETQHIELKSGFNDETIETLAAFANTKGGKVLVGVQNNGFLATLRYSQQKISNSSPMNTPIDTPVIVTSGEEKLLTLIRKNNKITREEIAVELGISINTVKQYIRNLKNKDILIRIGTNRTGHWLVKNK